MNIVVMSLKSLKVPMMSLVKLDLRLVKRGCHVRLDLLYAIRCWNTRILPLITRLLVSL